MLQQIRSPPSRSHFHPTIVRPGPALAQLWPSGPIVLLGITLVQSSGIIMLDLKFALTSSHPQFHNLTKIKEKKIQSIELNFHSYKKRWC